MENKDGIIRNTMKDNQSRGEQMIKGLIVDIYLGMKMFKDRKVQSYELYLK